jgi:hypothetical protein
LRRCRPFQIRYKKIVVHTPARIMRRIRTGSECKNELLATAIVLPPRETFRDFPLNDGRSKGSQAQRAALLDYLVTDLSAG